MTCLTVIKQSFGLMFVKLVTVKNKHPRTEIKLRHKKMLAWLVCSWKNTAKYPKSNAKNMIQHYIYHMLMTFNCN